MTVFRKFTFLMHSKGSTGKGVCADTTTGLLGETAVLMIDGRLSGFDFGVRTKGCAGNAVKLAH